MKKLFIAILIIGLSLPLFTTGCKLVENPDGTPNVEKQVALASAIVRDLSFTASLLHTSNDTNFYSIYQSIGNVLKTTVSTNILDAAALQVLLEKIEALNTEKGKVAIALVISAYNNHAGDWVRLQVDKNLWIKSMIQAISSGILDGSASGLNIAGSKSDVRVLQSAVPK